MGNTPARIFQIFLSVLLFLVVLAGLQPALANEHNSFEGIANKNPGTDLWRSVRQRDQLLPANSQVQGVDSGILINSEGVTWAEFRKHRLVNSGMIAIGGTILVVLLFYLLRGKIKIEGGLSGNMVFRYTDYERILHWLLAIVFLFLAITGLILLLGRPLLIPIFGHEIFSALASFSKFSHNWSGPIFIVSLLLMVHKFVRRNIYEKGDLTWLLKGGGMIGKSHVTGGFFNMGEKTWYWLVILVGLGISLTGMILVLPNLGLGRMIMELSHVLHVIGAIILMTVAIGHMYMGSVGTEGTSDGMTHGYVDIKWAEAHHDRWAEECHQNNRIIPAEEYQRIQAEKKAAPNPVASPNMKEAQ